MARKAVIRAWADGLTRVELLRNGSTIRTFDIPRGKSEFRTELEVAANGRAWYIARCYGTDESKVAITNPVWFEPDGWAPPGPASAQVRVAVRDSRTGQPLDGTVEVVRMVGKEPVVELRTEVRNGNVSLHAPATSRIRVQTPGYRTAMRSVFLDYAPLREMATNMRPEQLTEWATFEKVRDLLQNVTLEFRMVPQ